MKVGPAVASFDDDIEAPEDIMMKLKEEMMMREQEEMFMQKENDSGMNEKTRTYSPTYGNRFMK